MQTPGVATSRRELNARRDRVLQGLSEEGVDLAIFTTPETIYYLTGIELGGFWSQQALLLHASGAHALVVRRIEMNWRDQVSTGTWCDDWVTYSDDEHPADVIGTFARKRLPSRTTLGLELTRRSLAYESVERIQAALRPEHVKPIAHVAEKLRAIKSNNEVHNIRASGDITRRGMEAAAEIIREGGTDAEAAATAFGVMARSGSEYPAEVPFVAIGAEAAMAHKHWSGAAAADGELVAILMSASVRRYQCPCERTIIKGQADRNLELMIRLVGDAVDAVLNGLKPGLMSHEADRLARDVIEDRGFGDFFVNRLGYSFGIAFPPVWWESEIMQLRPHDKREVEAGMVFHLVPGLYVPGTGFITRSLPVLVTSVGCEPLIDLPLRDATL